MKLSILNKVLNGEVSTKDFLNHIESEVTNYKEAMKKKGSSITLDIDEDYEFIFTQRDLKHLCEFYLHGDISAIELSYVADCLTLSESISFKNETLRELVEEIAEPEINVNINKQKIAELLTKLN